MKRIEEKLKELGSDRKKMRRFKIMSFALLVIGVVMTYSGVSYAASAELNGVVKPIVSLINSIVNPLLMLVGAGGVIFCIMLGVKYATAEEPQEREKRKQSLKTAIIGFILIFVLVVALRASIGPLTKWMENSTAEITSEKTDK
ncbi:hypothetical protein SAMN04487934_103186 [Eubacterium ruminantium]|nr:hypothetical protein SAMN04487934_103186 [Eubacterium ruminantium]